MTFKSIVTRLGINKPISSMAKHPKLLKIEEDFENLDKFLINKIEKTARLEKIIELLKAYRFNAYTACIDLYKYYNLTTKYPESDIRERLKSKVRVYALKIQGLAISN